MPFVELIEGFSLLQKSIHCLGKPVVSKQLLDTLTDSQNGRNSSVIAASRAVNVSHTSLDTVHFTISYSTSIGFNSGQ